MRTVFNNIIDNGNLEPTPNTEYIYMHDTVWINHKSIGVDKGILVCDVEQEKYGGYTFCIVGEKDQRYNCAYGWAFVKNIPKNVELLEQIEKEIELIKFYETRSVYFRSRLDRLFTDKPNEPVDRSNDLSAEEIHLGVGDPHTMGMLNEARKDARSLCDKMKDAHIPEYDTEQNPNGLTNARWVNPSPSTNWFFTMLYKVLKHDMVNKLKVKHGEQFIDDIMKTFGVPSNLMCQHTSISDRMAAHEYEQLHKTHDASKKMDKEVESFVNKIHAGLPKVVRDRMGQKHIKCDCHPAVPERLKNMLNTKCRICGGMIGKPKEIDKKNIKCFKLIKPYPGMTKINIETSDSYGFRDDNNDELYPGMPWFLDWSEYWEPIMNKND